MISSSTRSRLVSLLRWVIFAELAACAELGLWRHEPSSPSAQQPVSSPCVGRAVVEPRHLHAVSLAVRDWSQDFMHDQGVGALHQPVLLSAGDQLLMRLNLDRAYLLAHPADAPQILEHLAGQRAKHLTGLSQLLPLELARHYERGFFTAWDEAWSQLELAGSPDAPSSLIEDVPAPLEEP